MNITNSKSMKTAVYEARSGERVARNGVYGEYYLGAYSGQMRVLSHGDIFPDATVGTTYVLHEEF